MATSDPELDKITQTIAGIQRDLAAEKAKNRADFPYMAKVRDQFDAVFGPCKTIWAEENGKSIGRKP